MATDRASSGNRAKTKYKIIAGAILVFVVFSALIVFRDENEELPDILVGRWVTGDKRYSDRFFDLSKATFTFGVGSAHVDLYFISDVVKRTERDAVLYTVKYKSRDGVEFTKDFYYYPEQGNLIKFKNQMDVEWRKVDEKPSK